jgi:hypothetical protein
MVTKEEYHEFKRHTEDRILYTACGDYDFNCVRKKLHSQYTCNDCMNINECPFTDFKKFNGSYMCCDYVMIEEMYGRACGMCSLFDTDDRLKKDMVVTKHIWRVI